MQFWLHGEELRQGARQLLAAGLLQKVIVRSPAISKRSASASASLARRGLGPGAAAEFDEAGLERDLVGHQVVQVEAALHIELDEARDVLPDARGAERRAPTFSFFSRKNSQPSSDTLTPGANRPTIVAVPPGCSMRTHCSAAAGLPTHSKE